MQSDRLLRGMHKVYSHDLPNQIVALQSLLQMLQLEESERLSKDGQEYVQRLQKVTQRTSQMARFLKEMGRLHTYVGKPETLALSLLARELQGSLKQQFPQVEFVFDWQWNVPTIVVDYRTFLQAVNEILGCLLPESKVCRLRAQSQALANQVALEFQLAATGAANDNKPHLVLARGASSPPAERMEMVLARELLAISHATLDADVQASGSHPFSLLVPSR